jgi:cysteine desulfurase
MQIYLDYNATAPLMPAARAAVVAGLDLLNASSVHGFGRAARAAVSHARDVIAGFLGVRPAQIIFTSGATEALVTALRGVSVATYIISAVEHEAVRATAQTLSPLPYRERVAAKQPGEGYNERNPSSGANAPPSPLKGEGNLWIIPVDKNGIINLEELEQVLKTAATPALVAVQFVNNETGVIQPVADIIALAKQYQALTLIDAVQAVGRIDLSPMLGADMMPSPRSGADMIVLAAHKMGGPRGAAALVLREGLSITPLITGGGQEERRRAGTENVAAIMGFGTAIEHIQISLDKQKDLETWREQMETEIVAALPSVKFYGQNAPRVANTSMLALPGVQAATQLMNLDLAGIAVSSGAACASGKVAPSHVLMAMGEGKEIAESAIRVSSGWATTAQDFQEFTRIYLEMARRLS